MTYGPDNRLVTYNGQQVTYDADGNMTYGPLNGQMAVYAYDCRNRLTLAGGTAYGYDAENNRIRVTDSVYGQTDYISIQLR
jgi:YD repeat-containing protein